MSRARALLLGLTAAAACTVQTPSGDPFPVHVDLAGGPVIVHVGRAGDAPITATLDVLAPFTVIDPGVGQPVVRDSTDLTLYGQRTPGATDLVARAQFSVDLVLLHPCDAATATCTVGATGAPTAIGAILGADALATGAVRVDFPAADVFILPDIAGSDALRDRECDARFPAAFRGGGTAVLGGADVDFTGHRIAIGACAGPGAYSATSDLTGTDMLLVASTGLGPTLIGASAYERYCRDRAAAGAACATPLAANLPPTSALLASGVVTGGAAQLASLTLVANPSVTSRGPCRDLYANYCLVDPACEPTHGSKCSGASCLCSGTSCGAPAAVSLTRAIDVVVVPDDDPTLQALRAELRPDQPEVDGVLGTAALAELQLDVDYPNGRLLARCGAGATACKVRPTLSSSTDPGLVADVVACVR